MFITFEGIDGSGKTTQIKLLAEKLSGTPHLVTREPGGFPMGRQIRELLLHGSNMVPLCDASELFLMLADRAQHVTEVIRPALAEGKTVISDRYIDSTLVYQGYMRNYPLDLLKQLNRMATGGLVPDLTILIDISPELSAQRISRSKDRIENDSDRKKSLLYHGYLDLAESEPQRFFTVDGSCSPEKIHRDIWEHVNRLLEKERV